MLVSDSIDASPEKKGKNKNKKKKSVKQLHKVGFVINGARTEAKNHLDLILHDQLTE